MDQIAPDLAVKLKCSEAEAGWGVLCLFRWALGRCPDDAPPSIYSVVEDEDAALLLANAAGFKGDPQAYVAACEKIRPALLEKVDGGIRVRGLDRYDAAWGRNNPEAWKLYKAQLDGEAKLAQMRGELAPKLRQPAADLSGNCDKPTHQTQTQTQKKTNRKEEEPGPIAKAGGGFFLWAQLEREAAHGLVAELNLDPPGTDEWFDEALVVVGDVDRLKRTYLAFLADPFWTKNRSRWAGFRKKWRDYVPPAEPAPPPQEQCKSCGTTEGYVAGGDYAMCAHCMSDWQGSGDLSRAVAGDYQAVFQAWIDGRRKAAA